MKKFNVIYADPPWQYKSKKSGGSMKSGAAQKYPVIPTSKLCRLDIDAVTEKSCMLFLWYTVPFLPDALQVVESWGFKFKTQLTWIKTGRIGTGYWFRGNTEHLMFATRGQVPAFRITARNHHAENPTTHSSKPEYFRDLIDVAISKVGFNKPIELFARRAVVGWSAWGKDVDSDVEINFKSDPLPFGEPSRRKTIRRIDPIYRQR